MSEYANLFKTGFEGLGKAVSVFQNSLHEVFLCLERMLV